jgi:hypothetical protein
MSTVSVNGPEPEEGDDGALHDFWALGEIDIRALDALPEADKLWLRGQGRRR